MYKRFKAKVLTVGLSKQYGGQVIEYLDESDSWRKYAKVPSGADFSVRVNDVVEIIVSDNLTLEGFGAMVIGKG